MGNNLVSCPCSRHSEWQEKKGLISWKWRLILIRPSAELEKKNRVKVSVYFRGRELAHTEMGYELLQKIAEEIQDEGTVDQPPKQEGRNSISMVVVPK